MMDSGFRAIGYACFTGLLVFQWLIAALLWLEPASGRKALPVQIAFLLICLVAPGSWRGAASAATRSFGRIVLALSVPPTIATLISLAFR